MAGCGSGDPMYFGPLGGVTKFLDSGIDGILSSIANAILGAAVSLFADVAGKVPTLGNDSTTDKIKLQINWLVVTIAVASLLFAAARMALERRAQAGTTAIKGLVRMILVAGAATYVCAQLATLADNYTDHLYQSGVRQQLKTIASCGTDSLTAFLLIIVGLLLILAAIIHIILLYIRLGVMVVLTGTLPVAAAASMTDWGSSWWRKHIAWMVAWLAFKPATGLVLYAGAVMINSTGTNASQQKIAGCGVLLLSAVALPALLRLVVPAAAALGSSDGVAGIAAGAAGYAAKTASGAVAVPAKKFAAGGSAKKSGPTGAASPGGAKDAKASKDAKHNKDAKDAKDNKDANGSKDTDSTKSASGASDTDSASGASGASDTDGSSTASTSGDTGSTSSASDTDSSSGAGEAPRGEGRSVGRKMAHAMARGAVGAARGTAGVVGFAAGHTAAVAGGAAKHAGNVVSGALPGVQDDDNNNR